MTPQLLLINEDGFKITSYRTGSATPDESDSEIRCGRICILFPVRVVPHAVLPSLAFDFETCDAEFCKHALAVAAHFRQIVLTP